MNHDVLQSVIVVHRQHEQHIPLWPEFLFINKIYVRCSYIGKKMSFNKKIHCLLTIFIINVSKHAYTFTHNFILHSCLLYIYILFS
jgi:hypothetical protein